MAIHPTAIIHPDAQLDPSVQIAAYVMIGPDVQLGEGVQVDSHAVIQGKTKIGPRCHIFSHAVLGGLPQDLKYNGEDTKLEIGSDNLFREFCTVNIGTLGGGGITKIGDKCLFMAYSHVAHDCQIGDGVVFANSVNLAGHVIVDDYSVIGGLVGIHQHCKIGKLAMIGGGAMVAQDVPPFCMVKGDRARLYGLNMVGLQRAGFSSDNINALERAYRTLFLDGAAPHEALQKIDPIDAQDPHLQHLIDFMRDSQRGICKAAK